MENKSIYDSLLEWQGKVMTDKISIVIADTEAQSTEVIKAYLKDFDNIQLKGEFADYGVAYDTVCEALPTIVIIDISKKPDMGLDLINKISTNNKTSKILVISSHYSADTIVKVMRMGADEFLPKPIIKEQLIKSINKLNEQAHGQNVENKKCRVITTFSNKGGIGKTSVAANLALELANITKEKVVLVDLNLQLGDITTFLDLKPSFDISHMIQNLSRIDETFLLSTLERYKDTSLYVLADPPYLEQAKDITAKQIGDLIEALKQTFSFIVVDTSASFDEKTITALDHSDLILLITIVNLPAIRNCQRCLDLFERLGYEKEKTKIVLNRYMENDEIKVDDVEDVLARPVYWKIPNNYFTIISAINKGVPVSVINPDSNISQSYRELATMLAEDIYKQDFSKKISRTSSFNLSTLFK